MPTVDATLFVAGLKNVVRSKLFVGEAESTVTIPNNIFNNYKHFVQHNIVQACYAAGS